MKLPREDTKREIILRRYDHQNEKKNAQQTFKTLKLYVNKKPVKP